MSERTDARYRNQYRRLHVALHQLGKGTAEELQTVWQSQGKLAYLSMLNPVRAAALVW